MTASGAEFSGVTLHSGTAVGTLLVLEAPLSFWGGSELASGRIVDERHPQLGQSMAGRVLAMHSG
ncbi:MAG: aconitase X swivel domain-containing protein, partial [Pseudonocardiaceae bacterium]